VYLRTQPTPYNLEYLKTKQKKLGHLLEVDEDTEA
jgi:GTP cyclohydrolase II